MTSPNLGEITPTTQPAFCLECGASLATGVKFCHRCGSAATPMVKPQIAAAASGAAVHDAASASPGRPSTATIVPWGVATLALVAVIAVIGSRDDPRSAVAASPPVGEQRSESPNIGSMSPSERANRLYVRVMQYAQDGKVDSVDTFAPMVMAAHEMLTNPTVDERYHYGRVAEVVGTAAVATAQADTILQSAPQSLLGLLLAARAARMNHNETAADAFDLRLLSAVTSELASGNADYESHRREIELAVAEASAKSRRP